MQTVSADLSRLAGRNVGLELRVDTGASSGQDWAVWVSPRITSGPRDLLQPGEVLTPGKAIASANGRFELVYQGDGNLVLYNEGLHASWASNTWNKCTDTRYYSKELGLQQDGNFVVYCHENGAGAGHYTPLWSTNTWCRSPGSDYCKP